MMEAGLKTIKVAKQNGSWALLDAVEELLIPDDLENALNLKPGAKGLFFKPEQINKKSHAAMVGNG